MVKLTPIDHTKTLKVLLGNWKKIKRYTHRAAIALHIIIPIFHPKSWLLLSINGPQVIYQANLCTAKMTPVNMA